MKKLQILLAAAMAGAVFAAASATAEPAEQGYATVVRVDGKASYSLDNSNWHPLQAGKYIPVGATVRTGDNGMVDMVLGHQLAMPDSPGQPNRISYAPDSPVRGLVNNTPYVEQNIVRIMPNTIMSIDKLTVTDTGADTVSDTELNIKQGKIYASVKKISGASQYLIKVPDGIAGVRGTELGIDSDANTECFASNNGGVVLSVVGKDGQPKTFLVAPGQMCSPNSGGGTTPIPPAMGNTLKSIFGALTTVYGQVVNYTFDSTQIRISPTQGNNGHHRGGGNSGNGGGNGG